MNRHLRTRLSLAFLSLFLSISVYALKPGDIAFIGFNHDGEDDFAIVALVDLPGLDDIFFSDGEPSSGGLSIDASGTDGIIQWITPVGGVTAGTIVVFTNISRISVGLASVSTGSITQVDTGFSLSTGNEGVVAYEANPTTFTTPVDWLAAYYRGSTSSGEFPDLTGTGLTYGVNALNVGTVSEDGGEYTGIITGQDDYGNYLAIINNSTNWAFESTNGENVLPFQSTSFSLPVDLAEFTATDMEEEGVLLKWETVTEEDNHGFEVQHSTDGKRWADLSFIIGNGTTQEVQNYHYFDKFPVSGTNYYRLKQMDYDGNFEYSEVVVIRKANQDKALSVEVGPNPTQSYLNYWIDGTETSVNITVFDLKGRIVLSLREQNHTGMIIVNTLRPGNYLLRIDTANRMLTKQFTVFN